MVPIETSMPFTRPDGLRSVGPQTMIQAEGQGRLTELTIKGNRAGKFASYGKDLRGRRE